MLFRGVFWLEGDGGGTDTFDLMDVRDVVMREEDGIPLFRS